LYLGRLAAEKSLDTAVEGWRRFDPDNRAKPVPVGAVSLASFALLNGQILAPTPSGAGAVELAAASGFIATEAHTGAIVAAWRVYVTILPIVAGLLFAAGRYGPRALLITLKRRDAS
jgi:uncharacterized membrane protein YbhN (UPF0104 family)